MADLPALLAVLEHDPDDAQALAALVEAARHAPPDVRTARFATARKVLATRGRPDVVAQLIDSELAATTDLHRQIDLLIEKGMVLDAELLDAAGARAAFEQVLALRADDTMAKEAIDELDVAAQNWQKFADKYIKEASASTDRSLATGLYVSAAEAFVRFAPTANEAEGYLRKALEIDPKNTKAAFHLARLLRGSLRWLDLAVLLEGRAELAATVDEKVSALLALAAISRAHLGDPARADAAIKRVLHLDPGQPQALRQVTEELSSAQNWLALVATYQAALKARRDGEDIGMLVQIAMVLWRHVGDLDQAEEYFRRVRKIEPAHPAALDFYRVYYPARGENQKLLALLRQVEKAPRGRNESARPIGAEIAELAEAQNNPEKAIESWKQILRHDPAAPSAATARAALTRLYRKTEKWNALLDLMKEEIDRLPEADVAGRVARLHDVVEIYRDKLRLDVMVINTYNAILKLDPDNARATDELAAKFRALGRWNDLIAVLTRKSETPDLPDADRIVLLREIADLWAERFGNFANAVRPLERILELSADPADTSDAIARLKEIYTKRRQWRALIDVIGREASLLPVAEKRAKQGEMARLAAERLGDSRFAIEIYNGILAEAGPDHAETLVALAGLYEREKRWLPLAEVLHRQIATRLAAGDEHRTKDAIGLLEKLGQVYADRLAAPQAGAEVWQQVLELEPNHARALRTLRELYAMAGDFTGLEKLYAKLGQEEELVDALLGIADRIEAKAARLPIVERAAQLAQQRADAAATGVAAPSSGAALRPGRRASRDQDGTPVQQAMERARQVWERVLSVEPQHTGAAAALAPIYAAQEKWARLITVHEIELSATTDQVARLAKIAQIRQLCEQKLASRALAFTWTLRAFELDPASEQLHADVLRLASETEHWREVAATFERHATRESPLEIPVKLKLLRELARIANRRLGDADRARGYHRLVLELEPEAREAEQHLEELAIQLADWNELLGSYRRRAAREKDPTERASLLIEIASLQEEKLVDLDGAATTYREALAILPNQVRALRSLARIEEARGDWEALVEVLAAELQQVPDGQPRFDLLMRIGVLEEQSLERPARALASYRTALAIPAPGGGPRSLAVAAIARLVLSADRDAIAKLDPKDRVTAVRLVLPQLEASKNLQLQATAIEVIRAAEDTPASERLELDRQLMRLYHTDLGDPAAAWQAGLRVLAAEPGDTDVRGALGVLAGQLGRDGEWARHLASALASMRAANAPSSEIRAIATELATLGAERLDDRPMAERAWLTVLEVESDAADAFEALANSYRVEERWNDLRALLERRTQMTLDDRVRLRVLVELAALEEDVLAQPARAADAHRRVLDIDASHLASYHALDRLYSASEQWRELEALLAQQADHARNAGEMVQLSYRRAELFAHCLGEPSRAVDLLEDVVSRERTHVNARLQLEALLAREEVRLRVARILEPLYEHDRHWEPLITVLRAQRTLASGTEAVELLSRIATIEEAEIGDPAAGFAAWIEVLSLDPTHERARVEISRLAQQLGRWPEATAALEVASNAAPAGDVTTRGALLGELATYYDVQLGDAPRAIAAYRRLLEMDASNPAAVRKAATALARLYDESKAWPELRGVMRRLAEWAEDAGERRALLARVAALEEDQLAAPAAAITTWNDILTDQPMDAGALNALERLYQRGEHWRELVDVLRRKLDHHSSAAASAAVAGTLDTSARDVLARIAELHEVMLEEPEEAITAYLDILDRNSEDRHALIEVGRLYREAGRHADLLDILERQAALGPQMEGPGFTPGPGPRMEGPGGPGMNTALQIEIAQLLSGPLMRPIEALERWSTVLQAEPDHPQGLGAVEGALADPELRVMAADILRPVYDATNQHERLAVLQERAAEWADDPAAKLRALGEVVKLREHRLGDKAGAFAAQLMMLQHATTEPELPTVVADTERLAGELGRESDLIDAYREIAPNVLDADIQRRLYLDVADLSRAVRHDMALAREYYQKVLDAQPDDRRALVALESIYRDTNDDERLTEVLLRQADTAASDVEDRVGALVEAAGLYVGLRRPDDAIGTWEQVLAIAPERRDAVEALEALYREQGRWPDVVDLYERRLGFATSIEEAVALRVQLGEIHEKQLRDFETAIDNFSAALSGDSRNTTALAAVERYLVDPDLRVVAAEVLEPIYVSQQRWPELIRVYEARLESATDPRDRLKLTRYVARLYEEQLEDFESASRWYAKVFREAPSDPAIRDQLQRLATMVDNWRFVAETYQMYLDDESGDSDEIRDVAIAAAAIYDRRLGDVDAAYAAYRRALSITIENAVPNERELLRRLEEMLGRAQKWNELVTIYEDVIGRSGDDLRREALIKRARLLEDGIADPVRAIEGWREVVQATEGGETPLVEHAYREAVGELERLYRARSAWRDLVDLFEARIARTQHPSELAEIRLRLADVFETNLADLPAALDQYQLVIEEGPLWDRAVASLERLVVHDEYRERITELLEPVYREQDWWQKLVVILDAKLDFVRDPADQITTLHEIARLHEERGGALDLAVEALARAWRIDVAEDDSLQKFLALAAKLEAWDYAVTQLEEGAVGAPNSDLGAGLWARAAQIHEAHRSDLPRAIAAWRKVEEARADDMIALAALDRLLAIVGRVDELVKVVERRAELTEDGGVRLVLLHRVAGLYEEVLEDTGRAIGAYRNVLAVDDTDLAALDALERLYAVSIASGDPASQKADARELASTLERKIELTTELAARQDLRRAAAEVHEVQLGDDYQAISQLTAMLDDDAGEQRALAELDRIYTKRKIWPELLDIVDKRALLAANTQDRADFAFRAAHIVETELSDSDAAVPRYGAVLQVLATHEPARAALEALMLRDEHVEAATPILERVYRAERNAPGLIRVYERRLAANSGDAREDWAALADVHESIAGAPAEAFAVWSRAIAADPEDTELLAPLLRLAEADRSEPPGLWGELAMRLDGLLGQSLPPEAEQLYAMRLGQIAEDKLENLEGAAAAYERASHTSEPRPALAALERVLAHASRWTELAAVLRRQADSAESDAQIAEYLYRLADLQETTLHDPRAAIVAYREVLTINPAHPGSRAALERLLLASRDVPDIRGEIVEILEPLFEQDGDAARLAGVLEARIEVTPDAIDRAAILQRLVELFEEKLADRGRALDAALRWLAIDPTSNQALAETDRLAERLGQWPEVAGRVATIVHAPDAKTRDRETQVALLGFLGRIQRERLGHLDDAATTYGAALALDPDAIAPLDELITILRQRGDQVALAEALRQRGKVVAETPEKRAAYAEVAQICERAGDRDAAIAAWREIADLDDSDRGALDELARLYRATGNRQELADTLGRAARLAASADDEKALRVELAQLEADGPRAVAAWQGVLDLDPDDLSALAALQAAHARAKDWMAVADIQNRRLALAKSTWDKVAIHAEMAQVAEQHRGSVDDAIAAWFSALDVDAAHKPAFVELERLLAAAGRHHDLVELLERYAALQATLGDGHAEIAALARAADVWEAKLDNPDAAGEILEKILKREPGSVAALTRLSKIYERGGDWGKCKATLEQALKLSPTGRDAADLFFRLGEVARVGDSDAETAIMHFQQALKHDPSHAASVTALEQLARDRRDTTLLADMLQRRVSSVHAPTERVAILVELAELERKAGRNDAALAALAKAAEDAPGDARILAPLADLYFAASRFDEAAPIYAQLAEEAKGARRMKDVARFRGRQGGILEARGDVKGALAAYEEALRVNPTDIATMSGLGRLYFEAQDWEKARKIYQSLVLQNIESDAGVTKAEVYWALGKIHLQLGQPPKAKSMFQRGLEIEPHNQRLKEALSSLS